MLSIATRQCDPDITVIEFKGRITLGRESSQIETSIIKLIGDGVRRFVLDLAQVEYLDSTGIGMIAYSFGKITQAGGQTRVCGATGLVLDLFRITRLDSVIQFFPDAATACASLAPKSQSAV